MSDDQIHVGAITPTPTEEEVAAIMAAVVTVWPSPSAADPVDTDPPDTIWRFSNRWWHRSARAIRRRRPPR